ncbi:PotD/PotF family extracellular solute-binding protein [Bordetella sp. N]|uniref:ABC transporter substrate-binding protein n=1 Tax=Bordetella sp. N TaxID=1746199 RepID=UPI000708F4B5|nr:extracellular solute-binding protein [Bordetella sp. N]ALM85983.1 hypothetical protein ASB57_26245 [Bordetella sp. N]
MSAGVLLTSVAPAFAADTSINVMLWGTTWQSSIKAASQRFTEQTGIKVNVMTQASSGEGLTKLQTMRERSEVDVWFTTDSVATRASGDKALFAPLPKDTMPNLAQVSKGAATDYYAAAYGYPMSIVYRPDLVKEPITSFQELWTRKDLQGKLGVPAMTFYQGRMLMLASLAFGGTTTDSAKGFEMLTKLKPQVSVFLTSDAQARNALAQGEVAVLVVPPAAGKRVADAGVAVKVVSPKPAIMSYDVMMLVNGPKKDSAARFIDFIIGAQENEAVAGSLNMAPVNVNAKPSAMLADQLPKEADKVSMDEAYINQNIASWTERFNNEIAK